MKYYIVDYRSDRNIFRGKRIIEASSLREAQDIFLNWIAEQEVYNHLWNLYFEMTVVEDINDKAAKS